MRLQPKAKIKKNFVCPFVFHVWFFVFVVVAIFFQLLQSENRFVCMTQHHNNAIATYRRVRANQQTDWVRVYKCLSVRMSERVSERASGCEPVNQSDSYSQKLCIAADIHSFVRKRTFFWFIIIWCLVIVVSLHLIKYNGRISTKCGKKATATRTRVSIFHIMLSYQCCRRNHFSLLWGFFFTLSLSLSRLLFCFFVLFFAQFFSLSSK